MALTAQQIVRLNARQSLGLTELKTLMMDAVENLTEDVVESIWGLQGWIGEAPTITFGAGTFSLEGGCLGTDGSGSLLKTGTSFSYGVGVPFQNTSAVNYHVGLMRARVPAMAKNSRLLGKPQYTAAVEIVGVAGTPDSVVDNGNGTITMIVDTVTEAGVSNAGRTVMMYLVAPQQVGSGVLEDAVVVWDGTNNKVTTAAKFGQGTISTTAADYAVVLYGPRVARNTDLSGEDGVLYVGTITGNGGTPTVYSTAGATEYPGFDDLTNVTEFGPNGDLKIRVKAHASDGAGDRQLSVYDPGAGVYTFVFDGAGNLTIKNPSGGATVFKIDAATGDISEFGGLLKSTQDNIQFYDVNMAAPVDLTLDGGDIVTVPAVGFQERSILGAIDGIKTGNLISCSVVSGCEPSDGGGLDLDIEAGDAVFDGVGWSLVEATVTLADVDETSYVRFNFATSAWEETTTYTGDTASTFFVAKVVKLTSNITSVVDIRRPTARGDRRTDITVGEVGSAGSYDSMVAHFRTLGDAFRAIDVWSNDDASPIPSHYRVRVVGPTTETGALAIPTSGIEVCGDGSSAIEFSLTHAVFNLNGKSNLWFHDLNLEFTGTVSGGSGIPRILAFAQSVEAVSADITIERVTLDAGDGFLYIDNASGVQRLTIRDCYAHDLGTCGVYLASSSTPSQSLKIVGNHFDKSGSERSAAYCYGVNLVRAVGVVVEGNAFTNGWLTGTMRASVIYDRGRFANNRLYCASVTPVAIDVIDSPYFAVVGNHIQECVNKAIYIESGDAVVVADNNLVDCCTGDDAGDVGVHFVGTGGGWIRNNRIGIDSASTTALLIQALTDRVKIHDNEALEEGFDIWYYGARTSIRGNQTLGGDIRKQGSAAFSARVVDNDLRDGTTGSGDIIVEATGTPTLNIITGNDLGAVGTITAHGSDLLAANNV
jgi:hypothetical protein